MIVQEAIYSSTFNNNGHCEVSRDGFTEVGWIIKSCS